LNKGESSFFRKFDCKTQSFGEEQIIGLKKVNIVEGSYSCHPDFFEFYDMSIFLTASPDVQKERIIKRNGEDGFKVFEQKWIPAEEEYFKKMNVKEKCTLSF
jgi:uridine kinase